MTFERGPYVPTGNTASPPKVTMESRLVSTTRAPEASFDTTFVVCIEAGPMEQQTCLLFETLRRWGGRFAQAPAMAVFPRWGPAVSRGTKRRLLDLNVEFIRTTPTHGRTWDKFLNKSTALSEAERRATSHSITFLDTDTFLAGEPAAFALRDGEDFACRPAERSLGSTGEGDVNESYWREVSKRFGLDIDSLGWITSWPEGDRIRRYWHTGAFVYRRETSFGAEFQRCHTKHFDEQLAAKRTGIYFTDQVSATLASRTLDLKCRELPFTHNFNVNMRALQHVTEERLRQASVVHYHDSMWPQHFDRFIACLAPLPEEVRMHVQHNGPLVSRLVPHRRLLRTVLNAMRERKYAAFGRTCTAY